jgi:hypothetical protein
MPPFAFGLVFGIAVTDWVAFPSSASGVSSECGGSPFMTRLISSPVRVSYSNRPWAKRSHSSFWSRQDFIGAVIPLLDKAFHLILDHFFSIADTEKPAVLP